MNDLRIGIVGCGAVTARSHLPVLQDLQGAEVTALADPSNERVADLAKRFNVPVAVDTYEQLVDHVDAVILALPHHLHEPIGKKALKAGKHVLMEKPLANTVGECDALVEAVQQSGVILALAQVRRYMTAYRSTKAWLASGLLGEITGFDAEEGGTYNWPVASDFFFRAEESGGGVLMDTGAHVLDALLWWLGDMEITAYSDDSRGGVEADCSLQLRTAAGATGTLLLSRVRSFKNTIVIHGTRADLEVGLLENRVTLRPNDSDVYLSGSYGFFGSDTVEQTTLDLFRDQAEDWLRSIRGEASDIATGEDGRRTIELISSCYSQRTELFEPWREMLSNWNEDAAHGL